MNFTLRVFQSKAGVVGLLVALGTAGCCCFTPQHATPSGPGNNVLTETIVVDPAFTTGLIQTQPKDVLVERDATATFAVQTSPGAKKHFSYQWYFNGALLPNETSNTLERPGTTNHVGNYSCLVTLDERDAGPGADEPNRPRAEMSAPASLMVYWEGSIIVQGTPVPSTTTSGTCPPPYVGYVKFTTPNGGWLPVASSTVYQARDRQSTNTSIRYWGGPVTNTKCSGGGKYVFSGAPSPMNVRYTFTIYFPKTSFTAVPANYTIELTGFTP